ncbi:HrcA family transcriptional regulator [Helicobacter cetorum]|uniref:Heat-inducible transcription repressor n=1 Tax=Helicobacter cetorum (strain ATCC BAA-429 / MIT 00-7128) TaxID=182217 RepID=I0EK45_HELC0|nr:HrcA family transcriptional regulator [Helicobacter cetorum]AFI03314.1 heat-inducible transcription repressor [Helicobacter cetorum MIT 00-7128]
MGKKKSMLDLFIKHYVQTLEPISSKRLKEALDLKVSCATIRNYFQALSKEGALKQAHCSSARLPTSKALKEYWQRSLRLEPLDLKEKALKEASERFGIFSLVKKPNLVCLNAVIAHEKRFLILDFKAFACVLDYSAKMQDFLQKLIGKSATEVRQIALSVNALSLAKQLENLEYSNLLRFNVPKLEPLMQNALFFEVLEGKILERLKEGLHFIEPNSMLVVHSLNNLGAKLLCFGKLECDYTHFFKTIS